MSVIVFFIGVLMLVVAVVLSRRAISGLALATRVVRRPTTAVSALRDGPVEVVGKVTAIGEPLLSLSGERCVAVKLTITGSRGTGKNASGTGTKTSRRVVPTRLVDASGACELDLDLSEVVGERWQSETIADGQLAAASWVDAIPVGSRAVTIEEEIIPDGATVLVSGDAALAPVAPESYRAGTADQWRIAGTAEQLLVLSLGGQQRLLARIVFSAAAVVVVAVYLGLLGLLVIAHAVAG